VENEALMPGDEIPHTDWGYQGAGLYDTVAPTVHAPPMGNPVDLEWSLLLTRGGATANCAPPDKHALDGPPPAVVETSGQPGEGGGDSPLMGLKHKG